MGSHNYSVSSAEETERLVAELIAANKGAQVRLSPEKPLGANLPTDLIVGNHETYGDTYRRARSCGSTETVRVTCNI